jgi:2-haloalkanoic acid dehalogenase type II
MYESRPAGLKFEEIKVLTFDCYGTLIDWECGIVTALRGWSKRCGISPSDDRLLEAFASAESKCQQAKPTALYPVILREAQTVIARSFGVEPRQEEANLLAESVGQWPAFPDSPDALRALSERYKLVIVSNIDHESFAQSRKHLGVDFDAVFTAQDIGAYKPDLRVFEYVLARLSERKIGKTRILHVAQSLYHDHVPAKKLGLKTAWVNRRAGQAGWGATPQPPVEVKPDLVVENLVELVKVLAV